jgi:hypothetical protein
MAELSSGVSADSDDGNHLRRLYEELKTHVGRDEAITSAELADRHYPDDGAAQPKTREAVKQVMREFGLPVVSCNEGYYIPNDPETIENELDSLQGRIDGIRERKQLLENNWSNWSRNHRQPMHEVNSNSDSNGTEEQLQELGYDSSDLEQIRESDFLTMEDVLAHELEEDT